MITFLLTVLLFLILIFPHELGHFIAAKLSGVQVNEFAVGMGPALIKRKRGETLYSLRLVPIGGYCAMEGENEESDNPHAFNNKKAWQKLLILSSGAVMNIFIALIIMIGINITAGVPTNTLGDVVKHSPADVSGVKMGDTITAVGDTTVRYWEDTYKAISSVPPGKSVNITVKRGDVIKTCSVRPEKDKDSDRTVIGVIAGKTHNPLMAVRYGAISTWNLNKALIDGIRTLIKGGVKKNDISGPVGIVSLVSRTKSGGAIPFLYLAALISLNLAIINLLPFPALDGGRIIFVIIRKITGGAITDKTEGYVHLAGMIILILLFVIITRNDILKLIGK